MNNLIHVPSHPHLKLGKRPETGERRLLHFNTIKGVAGIDTASPQPFDYSTGLPACLGSMYNNIYGCCADAAKAHRFQAVRFLTTGTILSGEDLQDSVLTLYAEDTGFDPTKTTADGTNPTDQGSNMQELAERLVKTGMTMPDGSVDRFAAAFLIDVGNMQDLIYCGRECVGIDLGIVVTSNVMPDDGSPPPAVWNAGGTGKGEHDVYNFAVLPNGNLKPNSWGLWYEMTPAYWAQNGTVAIAYVSEDALKDGRTVLGLDMAAWQNAVAAHTQQAA